MKKLITAILALMLCIMPALALAESDGGVITTTGYATVTATPDRARIVFGVEMIEPDAKSAQESVNTVIAAATEAIKALGIEDSQITTQSINIYREYDYSGSSRTELGFNASTTLTINISDITLAGAVIDAGLTSGLNTINTVSFSTSQESEYYAQALAQATKNAIAKGNALAEAAGVSVKSIASITEGYSSSIYTTTSRASGAMYDKVESAEYDDAGTTLSPGELTISAQVEVKLGIE